MKISSKITALLCAWMSIGHAAVSEKIYTNHYFVRPSQGQTLQEAVYNSSPISRDGKVYYGQTQWTVSPTFRYMTRGNLCYLSDIEIQLKVKFMLPKLHLDHPEPDIESRFERFYRALQVHEIGHQALGQEAAQTIADKLDNMVPHYDCEQLANIAKSHVAETIKHYKQRNSDYDQETQFGKTQGAVIR
ncbi:MAG: DUF922 domain-containing protein [Aestuariibacter sp.]